LKKNCAKSECSSPKSLTKSLDPVRLFGFLDLEGQTCPVISRLSKRCPELVEGGGGPGFGLVPAPAQDADDENYAILFQTDFHRLLPMSR